MLQVSVSAPARSIARAGFTLIELSIVLVIIGLIVGGVLTGKDLIEIAKQRAQISQIERYNTAVHTFQVKYGYLPGDLPDPYAAGFKARGTHPGEGDGNGLLQGYNTGTGGNVTNHGETVAFWTDLSTAGLIDSNLNTADECCSPGPTLATAALYFPAAKIGNGNYVYVYNGGAWTGVWNTDGNNYYGISATPSTNVSGVLNSTPGLTVQQAYGIDAKIDDGLPQSGSVTTRYANAALCGSCFTWAAGGGLSGENLWVGSIANQLPTTTATPYASTNCYDNNNVAGPQLYSLSQNANLQNCALSFKFQ